MARPTATDVINLKSPSERIQLAKAKITNVVNRISGLQALAESNAIIVYSPRLVEQIPASTAGHAFVTLQQAIHGFEIIQLCALWDKPDTSLAQNSIPTVLALIDDDEVINQIVMEAAGYWPDSGRDQDVASYNRLMRTEQGDKARTSLEHLRMYVPELSASARLASVKNLRDRELAHALDQTRAESRAPVTSMKYGDEDILLVETTNIIEQLYLWITGTHFNLTENRLLQRKRAEALWHKCRFDIAART